MKKPVLVSFVVMLALAVPGIAWLLTKLLNAYGFKVSFWMIFPLFLVYFWLDKKKKAKHLIFFMLANLACAFNSLFLHFNPEAVAFCVFNYLLVVPLQLYTGAKVIKYWGSSDVSN